MAEQGDETPTLPRILELAIEKRLLDLHVSMPASIEKYDGVKADVRPLLKRELRNGTIFELPVITNVPVIWPRTKKSALDFPLVKGDTGTLLVSERSLDIWLIQGGCINPKDFRKHDLSDAQFFPGLQPFNVATEFDPLRAVLKHGLGKMTIKETGEFAFTNGTEELMDLVRQLIDKQSETNDKISTATTNTIFGAITFNEFADFITLKGEVDTIGTKWDTLKE